MPQFSARSTDRLVTADRALQRVFRLVVMRYDCSILCGHRGQVEQSIAYAERRSHAMWPDSPHNTLPARAVDVAPYPIDWGESGSTERRRKAIARFYHFAGYVLSTAEREGVALCWGGDWDCDRDFSDQSFDDLVHFELAD